MFTRSPATIPWFVAPSVTAASPVNTRTRLEPDRQVGDRANQVESGTHGSFCVVFMGCRTPHTDMTASPMNFSTVPP